MKVKELHDQIGTTGPRPILYCSICEGEYSANAGDYWSCSDDTVLTCCDEPLLLVVKSTVYKQVQ